MNFIKTILSIFIKNAEKLPLATIKIPLKLVHLKPPFSLVSRIFLPNGVAYSLYT